MNPALRCILSVLALSQVLIAPDLLAQQDSSLTKARPAVLDPVVVTAERRPTRSSDASAAIRVVSSEELTRKAGTDLTRVLQDMPGVQIDPVVGSGAGVMLQGLGSDRVLVLVDGAPLIGRVGGELDITRLDPSMFRGIEIVEGPQSTLYGSNALGGVVNLLTRTDLARRVEGSTTVGSFGQLDGRARVSNLFGSWGGSFEVGRRTQDVAPGTGPTTAGFARRWDAMLRTQASVGSATLDIRALGAQENQQYRSGAASLNYNDNWQLDGMVAATLGRDGNTELRAHVSGYDHKFASGPITAGPGTPDWDRQRVFDIEGLRRGISGNVQWLTGAKLEREWITADRVAQGDERGGWTGAGYGSIEIPLGPRVQLSAGARLTASEEWGVNAAPRAAITIRAPAGFYLKAGGARGFRSPSFKDLYQDYLNPQARYHIRGNLDLTPETSWNLNGELGYAGSNVRLYARGYSNWLRNFIQSVQTGFDAGILLLDYQNVGRAETRGVEFGGSTGTGITEVSGSYAFLDAEDASTNLNLTGRAQHSARAALTLSPDPVSVRGEVVHSGRLLVSRTAAGVETFQGAYTRLNANAIVTLPLGLRATLGVENLADVVPDGAVAPLGRRWHASMTWGAPW